LAVDAHDWSGTVSLSCATLGARITGRASPAARWRAGSSSTVCVIVHARGDEADGIGGDDLAVTQQLNRESEAQLRRFVDGTCTYASACPSSMVVIIVRW
jgi:hypothetical protein